MKLTLYIMLSLAIIFNATAQTLGTKQRMKMMRHYYLPQETYGDSVVFAYSGSHGSVFNPLNYSACRGYCFSPFIDIRTDMPEPIDDVYKESVWYDTAIQYTIFNDTKLYREYSNVFSGNRIETRYFKHSHILQKQVYDIDALGNVKSKYELTGIDWDTTGYAHFWYDAENRVIADSIFTGSMYRSGIYKYNANGQLTEMRSLKDIGGFQPSIDNVSFVYNSFGKLLERIEERYNASISKWDTIMHDHIRWDGLGRLKSFVTEYYSNGDSTINYTLHYKDGNSRLPDTLVKYGQALNGIMQCIKTVFYYNEYGNPDSAINYVFAGCTSFSAYGTRTYYQYELYTEEDTTVLPQPKDKIIVFPNPARDAIKIRWNEDKPTSAHVYLYNSIGQVVGSTYIAKPQDEDRIMLPALAAGVYYMRINTGGGGKLFAGSVYVY